MTSDVPGKRIRYAPKTPLMAPEAPMAGIT
jgi:hypothetical protein